MQQTFILLTQTQVDYNKLNQVIGANFTANSNLLQILTNLDIAKIGTHYQNKFIKGLNDSKIIEFDFGSKEEFSKNLMSLFRKYSEPTLTILGNLSKYDESLQEGMLKLLEEPPANLILLLYAEDKSKILPTILSRSQISTIQTKNVMQILDQNLCESVASKLPKPSEFIKSWLNDSQTLGKIDFKKTERSEINFWLWQLETYSNIFYQQINNTNLQNKLGMILDKILYSKKLNQANVQKKFVLESLLI